MIRSLYLGQVEVHSIRYGSYWSIFKITFKNISTLCRLILGKKLYTTVIIHCPKTEHSKTVECVKQSKPSLVAYIPINSDRNPTKYMHVKSLVRTQFFQFLLKYNCSKKEKEFTNKNIWRLCVPLRSPIL